MSFLLARVRPTYLWHGVLTRRPFPDRPTLANNEVFPLRTDGDFAVAATFPGSPDARVLLNFGEHYELLGQTIAKALAALPEAEFVLVRLNLPAGKRLPPSLLDERVFILQDVQGERDALVDAGRSVLVVADRFVRTDTELGDNHLVLEWHGSRDAVPRLNALVRELGQYGLDEVQDAS